MATMAASLALLTAAPASALTIGSNLRAPANAGICPTVSGVKEVSCTYLPFGLTDSHAAPGGERLFEPLVVTSWRVASGLPAAGTVSVKLRLRAMQLGKGPAAGPGTPYVDLPLTEPGIHVFESRLPLDGSQEIGLDAVVTGLGDGASAPVSHRESGVGKVAFWRPSLGEELIERPFAVEYDTELLLNATVEPDKDRDGYGDRTQDECPRSPERQDRCDVRPPRIKLRYAPRQDFVSRGPVVVRVRANEDVSLYAPGQIDLPGVGYGIYAVWAKAERGEWRTLRLRVPRRSREHIARAHANGKPAVAKVRVYATDAADNKTGPLIARIRPKR
jgi:hypothetical protein